MVFQRVVLRDRDLLLQHRQRRLALAELLQHADHVIVQVRIVREALKRRVQQRLCLRGTVQLAQHAGLIVIALKNLRARLQHLVTRLECLRHTAVHQKQLDLTQTGKAVVFVHGERLVIIRHCLIIIPAFLLRCGKREVDIHTVRAQADRFGEMLLGRVRVALKHLDIAQVEIRQAVLFVEQQRLFQVLSGCGIVVLHDAGLGDQNIGLIVHLIFRRGLLKVNARVRELVFPVQHSALIDILLPRR